MKKIVLFLLLLPAFWFNQNLKAADISVDAPEVCFSKVNTLIEFQIQDHQAAVDSVYFENATYPVKAKNGNYQIEVPLLSGTHDYTLEVGSDQKTITLTAIPLWLSVIPPLIAIIMALITGEVLGSLFLGVFSGAAILGFYTKGALGILTGFLSVFDTYLIGALNNEGHLSVILFSMTIGAVVALISKNGGMRGVVNKITGFASTPKRGRLATYFLGISIFFDDYANTLVVGNTMRPVTDKLKISREKLAYLVDSTAAPIAAIAFVTTWIGAELGYIADGLTALPQITESPYSVFLNSLAYSFYPILTLAFILMMILMNKDFGPMFKAEKRAAETGVVLSKSTSIEDVKEGEDANEFKRKEGTQPRGFNAVIPVLIIVLGTLAGLWITGTTPEIQNNSDLSFFQKLSQTIGNADAYVALLWSSLSSLAAAVILTLSQKLLTSTEIADTIVSGFKSMMSAIMILVLAWALAQITQEMHTAAFLKSLWSPALSPVFIPAITFILAALTAFSTGSSWGTMAILYPLLLPAAFTISMDAGFETEAAMSIFYNVTSCVLAGSVLGDHCSPISDTTILSSLASGCHHIDHVRTQMPYALTVGVIAVLVGTLPAAAGISTLWLFPAGIVVLFLVIKYKGKELPL